SQPKKPVFHWFFVILCHFFLYLSGFARFYGLSELRKLEKPRKLNYPRGAHFHPKSTFLLGAAAPSSGVFSASTSGASSLKCLMSVCAKFVSSAVSAGSVVLSPHCFCLIKSIAGCSGGNPFGGRVSASPSNSLNVFFTAGLLSTLRNSSW